MPSTAPDRDSSPRPLHVAVAVIGDRDGRILIARRARHLHQGGLWEFPGGKLEPGEGVRDALRRELREELGIVVEQARPLIRIHHAYPEYSVLLDTWRVTGYHGEPFGREGQPLRWVRPERLPDYPVPAANRAIVSAVRLPQRYLITPEPPVDDLTGFLSRLERALRGGVRLIQLRSRKLGGEAYRQLAQRMLELAHRHQARLLLNTEPQQAAALGADGVHLTSERLLSLQQRPLDDTFLIGASCHDERELARAAAIGADFAVLGAVLPTSSHPGVSPLGWERFTQLVEGARLPVFALGGMGPGHLDRVLSSGSQGIAAIRALWGD